MKIYNTLTKNLEEFKPIKDNKVSFYQCGPTVYWVQHIGNMRAMTMADLIRRSLIFLDYDVKLVRNYTDVGHLTSDEDEGEDKMEKGAKREGLSPDEIAQKYINIFENDIRSLNIIEADHKPKATEYIQEMIQMIQVLVDKGFGYVTPKAIYFDVSKFKNYNELNKQILSENEQGAGTGDISDSNKRNPYDFALWFFRTGPHRNAMQYWESPFYSPDVDKGEGFPGWHIECSAMSKALLGDTIDIHMGGIEHIPVHHTNEIAQSEAANGTKFVNYWIHNEHLNVDRGKMSKSEGTSFTIQNIVNKGYNPMVLRYFFLQAHYRSKQNFTWEALDSASVAYKKLIDRVSELMSETQPSQQPDNLAMQNFISAINEDFNIPKAIAVLWDLLKSNIEPETKLTTILRFDEILGLNLSVKENHKTILPEAQILVDERQKARENKDWQKADQLRDELKSRFNIEIKDTPEGQKIV